jgi:hypothetical protein
VAEAVGKSLSAVERASANLVRVGKLKYVGPKKGGHWEVFEECVMIGNFYKYLMYNRLYYLYLL